MDQQLLLEHLRQLKAGASVQRPSYSFCMRRFRTEKTVTLKPAPVIIVEGILVLAIEALRREYDLSIYVDSADDLGLIRRIERDTGTDVASKRPSRTLPALGATDA